MRHLSKSSTRLRLIGAVCVATALVPSAAQAACGDQTSRQVFSRFGDAKWYYPAPGGTFEPGVAAWTHTGSGIVAGNETYFINSSGDRQSLKVPAGASALSPSFCVSAQHPTLRMMARKLSGSAGTLKVEVVYSGGTKPAGSLVNTGQYLAWRPTQQFDLATALAVSGTTTSVSVRLRLRADSAGPWGVDDVFIDPYRR